MGFVHLGQLFRVTECLGDKVDYLLQRLDGLSDEEIEQLIRSKRQS
jgi:hypothetical protein